MGVAVSGSYAYVADGLSGLRVIDVSDACEPLEVGFVDIPGEPWRGRLRQLRLRRGRRAGLRVIDVSTPASPIEVGFVRHPGARPGRGRLRQLRLRRGWYPSTACG